MAGLGEESEPEEEEATRGVEVQAAMAAAGAGGASEEVEATESEAAEGHERDDPLVAMMDGRRRRRAEDDAMRARVHDVVETLMDNGVRMDPRLRGAAGAAAGAAVTTEVTLEARSRRCQVGHTLERCRAGGAGLRCDGGCGRALRRGAWRWSCEECDLDICEECSMDG